MVITSWQRQSRYRCLRRPVSRVYCMCDVIVSWSFVSTVYDRKCLIDMTPDSFSRIFLIFFLLMIKVHIAVIMFSVKIFGQSPFNCCNIIIAVFFTDMVDFQLYLNKDPYFFFFLGSYAVSTLILFVLKLRTFAAFVCMCT